MLAQQLGIYKVTYSFTVEYINRYKQIRALHKFTLGSKIYSMLLELFEIIENANRDKSTRGNYLSEFLVKLNTIKTMLRIARDCKVIGNKEESIFGTYISSLSKQATAWKNAQ